MRYSEWIQKDKINTGRQQEIDLARAIPVLSLPFVHCVIECSSLESIGKPIPFFFDVVIGAPLGAPIFMFCMGISLLYTKHNSYKDMLKRGLILFIAGFVLNIIRFAIPYLTGYLITGEYDKYIAPMPFKVFGNDILQFAGLAFMLLGLLKKLKISDMGIVGVATVMSLVGWNFRHVNMRNDFLNIALGHIIGTEAPSGYVLSDFPLLNWFLVPVAGYIFGNILIRVQDKRKFYCPYLVALAGIYLVYFVLEVTIGFGMMNGGKTIVEGENNYYHAEFFDIIGYITCAVGMMGVYFLISSHCPEKLNRFFNSLSRNITRIYIIHWFFVVMSTNVIIYRINGTQELPLWQTMLLALIIFLLSYCLSLWLEKRQLQKKAEKKAAEEKATA